METTEYAFVVENQNGIAVQVPINIGFNVNTSFGGPSMSRRRSFYERSLGAGYTARSLSKSDDGTQYVSSSGISSSFPDPQIGGVPNSRTVIVALDSIYPFEVQKF